MCEFCAKHGDGMIWYKNAANYAQDLLSDLHRREYIEHFFESTIKNGFQNIGRLEALFRKKGYLPVSVKRAIEERAMIEHFGQVLPIEEIRDLMMKASTVVRIPCACRWTAQKKEVRCCYCISFGPDPWYNGINMSYFGKAPDMGLEALTRQDAIRQMEEMEECGAIHSIWTLMTPFIGSVCNCALDGCLALRTQSDIGVETLARAEYVALVNEELCIGCGNCKIRCQFDAISAKYENGKDIAVIERHKCFGCGLCRKACDVDAISLELR